MTWSDFLWYSSLPEGDYDVPNRTWGGRGTFIITTVETKILKVEWGVIIFMQKTLRGGGVGRYFIRRTLEVGGF